MPATVIDLAVLEMDGVETPLIIAPLRQVANPHLGLVLVPRMAPQAVQVHQARARTGNVERLSVLAHRMSVVRLLDSAALAQNIAMPLIANLITAQPVTPTRSLQELTPRRFLETRLGLYFTAQQAYMIVQMLVTWL
ncbi:hypothetical protein ONS95_004830 [Cadophora gregata]|uniref:uncharacterized protein n=1 Tax=Cadophora gregata TaxID=51156 RepID=UPI0026DBAFEB|nr:uncharacterized protein ONS95_004830 [Cadophora gregata]KAK0104542.1 hypothetical protein ONS95_004830 [Cadophora gregata]